MCRANNLTTILCRCHAIWELPRTLWATQGLQRNCFTVQTYCLLICAKVHSSFFFYIKKFFAYIFHVALNGRQKNKVFGRIFHKTGKIRLLRCYHNYHHHHHYGHYHYHHRHYGYHHHHHRNYHNHVVCLTTGPQSILRRCLQTALSITSSFIYCQLLVFNFDVLHQNLSGRTQASGIRIETGTSKIRSRSASNSTEIG